MFTTMLLMATVVGIITGGFCDRRYDGSFNVVYGAIGGLIGAGAVIIAAILSWLH